MSTIDSTSPSNADASETILDRNTASNYNPFIGIHAAETMERCERAISDLGYVISGAGQMRLNLDTSNMFRLFEATTIALRYEIKAAKQGAQA